MFLARYALVEFLAVAILSYLTGLIYRNIAWPGSTVGVDDIESGLLLASGIPVVSLSLRHYAAFERQPDHRVLWNAATAVVVTFAFFQFVLFLFKQSMNYSRAAFILQLLIVFIIVLTTRAIAHARVREAIAAGRMETRRAVVIGASEDQILVARKLGQAGIKVVRTLWFPASTFDLPDLARHAEVGEMLEACRAAGPDHIVIATKAANIPNSLGLAGFLSELPVSVHLVPIDCGALLGSARLGDLGTLVAVNSPLNVAERALKRLFDIVAASIGLLVLCPPLLVVAAVVKLDSRGPVLFRQIRHGYNNENIRVNKFRTMTTLEDGHAFTQATQNDPRITRFGRLLRRSNIDELPQLINVLTGEMSIVGPRPHPVAMNRSFEKDISRLSRRHNVKPGITGWAQVNGYRGEIDTLEKMHLRFEYDLHYIDNWSFQLDLKIILMTLFSKAAYRNAR